MFVNGLITLTRNIVKPKGIKTLEEAISVTLEEAQSYEIHRLKTNKTYIKNNNFPKKQNNNNYKPNFNKQNNYQPRPYREQVLYIKQERNDVKIICAYCKKRIITFQNVENKNLDRKINHLLRIIII